MSIYTPKMLSQSLVNRYLVFLFVLFLSALNDTLVLVILLPTGLVLKKGYCSNLIWLLYLNLSDKWSWASFHILLAICIFCFVNCLPFALLLAFFFYNGNQPCYILQIFTNLLFTTQLYTYAFLYLPRSSFSGTRYLCYYKRT